MTDLRHGINKCHTGHEAETNTLLPYGIVELLPSEGSTVSISLVNASSSPRVFLEIKAEEQILEWKKKWEEERKRISLEDKLKKLELEQQVSAQGKGRLEIIQLVNTLKQASKEADEIQVRLLQEQSEREKAQQKHSKLEDVHQKLQQDLSSYKQQLLMRETEKKVLRKELQAIQTKVNDQTVLFNDHTRKLQGGQGFLSKADTLSGGEVVRLVDGLNQEIMQTAAFISDSFDFVRKPEHRDEIKETSKRTSELIGPAILRTVQHGEDPLLIQIALQAATVEFGVLSLDHNDLGL